MKVLFLAPPCGVSHQRRHRRPRGASHRRPQAARASACARAEPARRRALSALLVVGGLKESDADALSASLEALGEACEQPKAIGTPHLGLVAQRLSPSATAKATLASGRTVVTLGSQAGESLDVLLASYETNPRGPPGDAGKKVIGDVAVQARAAPPGADQLAPCRLRGEGRPARRPAPVAAGHGPPRGPPG